LGKYGKLTKTGKRNGAIGVEQGGENQLDGEKGVKEDSHKLGGGGRSNFLAREKRRGKALSLFAS